MKGLGFSAFFLAHGCLFLFPFRLLDLLLLACDKLKTFVNWAPNVSGWPDLLRRALCVLLRGGGPQAQEGGAGRPHPPRQRQRQPPGSEVLPQPVDNHLMRHFVIASQIVCKYVHVQQVVLQFTMYYSKCFFVSNLSVISKVVSYLQNVKYQFNGSSIFY